MGGSPAQQLADAIGHRQSIDEQTQGWINQMRSRGAELNGGESGAAWRQAKMLRKEQPHNVPLRNAEHFLWSQSQGGVPGLIAPLYLGYKYIKDPSGNSSPDPLGQLIWGMKPIFYPSK